MKIAKIWKKDGYNIGENPDMSDHEELGNFLLFSYKNSKDIVGHMFGEYDNDVFIVVGYKIDTKSLYTVLLQLSE